MNPYVLTAIGTSAGIVGVVIAYCRFRRDEFDKKANVQVEHIDWIQEATNEGSLKIRLKNSGGRAASNISASVRMIDHLLETLPAPNFDYSRVNELQPGESVEHEFSWCMNAIFTHVNVQITVSALDAVTGKACLPKQFYYKWGELGVFKLDQSFRDMTAGEVSRLRDFLVESNHRRKIGPHTVYAIPGVPDYMG